MTIGHHSVEWLQRKTGAKIYFVVVIFFLKRKTFRVTFVTKLNVRCKRPLEK